MKRTGILFLIVLLIVAIRADMGGATPPLYHVYSVYISLSEPPIANKTVTATVGVTSIYEPLYTEVSLVLYRRTSFLDWRAREVVWEKSLWNGTVLNGTGSGGYPHGSSEVSSREFAQPCCGSYPPPEDSYTHISSPLTIEEPGKYFVAGRAGINGSFGLGDTPLWRVVPSYGYIYLEVGKSRTTATPVGEGELVDTRLMPTCGPTFVLILAAVPVVLRRKFVRCLYSIS